MGVYRTCYLGQVKTFKPGFLVQFIHKKSRKLEFPACAENNNPYVNVWDLNCCINAGI